MKPPVSQGQLRHGTVTVAPQGSGCSVEGGKKDRSLPAALASVAASPACALLVGFYFFQLAFLNPRVFSHPSCLHMFSLVHGEEKYLSACLCHVPAPAWTSVPGETRARWRWDRGGWRVLHCQSCHQPQKLHLAGKTDFSTRSQRSLLTRSEGTKRQQYSSCTFI